MGFLITLCNKIHVEVNISWSEVKEKIKERINKLTDADLNYRPGQEEKLFKHFGEKMNRNADEIKSWIKSVSGNNGQAS